MEIQFFFYGLILSHRSIFLFRGNFFGEINWIRLVCLWTFFFLLAGSSAKDFVKSRCEEEKRHCDEVIFFFFFAKTCDYLWKCSITDRFLDVQCWIFDNNSLRMKLELHVYIFFHLLWFWQISNIKNPYLTHSQEATSRMNLWSTDELHRISDQ